MTGIIENKMINFFPNDIPVHITLPRLVDVPLASIIPDQYTLMINATNQIGTVTVYNNTFYVPGKIINSIHVCVSLSVTVTVSVSVSVYVCLCLCISVCVCLCLCLHCKNRIVKITNVFICIVARM